MPIIDTSLTIEDLPPPPPHRSGWPWTEQGQILPPQTPDNQEWPLISIVTPSFNQGQFLEETIRSVLLQGYPHLEYIIVDGGSTDETIDIIRKYEPYLAYWVSEPDRGQSHALNKGFYRSTGWLVGWQNSDDFYAPDALSQAIAAALQHPEADIIHGTADFVNIHSAYEKPYPVSAFSIEDSLPFLNACNQSMFFKHHIFEQGDFLNESYQHAMDYEFMIRLFLKGYQFHYCPEIKGCFRVHPFSKGSTRSETASRESAKVYQLIYEHEELPETTRQKALNCMYSHCLDDFSKLRFNLFRESVRRLLLLTGPTYLKPSLILKYGLSYLNPELVKGMKARLQKLGMNTNYR